MDGMIPFGRGDAKSGVVPFGLDTPPWLGPTRHPNHPSRWGGMSLRAHSSAAALATKQERTIEAAAQQEHPGRDSVRHRRAPPRAAPLLHLDLGTTSPALGSAGERDSLAPGHPPRDRSRPWMHARAREVPPRSGRPSLSAPLCRWRS
jgi:hypothetical protein